MFSQPKQPHYYALLSRREQTAYHRLLEGFQRFAPRVALEDLALLPEELVETFHYVTLDHPEIFWVKWECNYQYRTLPGGRQAVTQGEIHFNMTAREAEHCQREIDRVAEPVFRHLKGMKGSEWEKVRWLHDTIIGLADFDYSEISPERKQECNHSIYGVFVNRLAVCEGYAEAMTWLLNRAGIPCITCMGGGHAWNIISVEGIYSHFDVTWDDLGNYRGENGVCYRCFGLTTGEMDGLHGFASRFPVPRCDRGWVNFHQRLGYVAESLPELHRQVRRAVTERRPWLELRVTDRGLLEQITRKTPGIPLWLPRDGAAAVKKYRIFQPDYLTGWLRVELEYR